jgi:hypothetical protein
MSPRPLTNFQEKNDNKIVNSVRFFSKEVNNKYISSPFSLSLFLFFFSFSIPGTGIETGFWLDYREAGVRVPEMSRFFSALQRPNRLYNPHTLLSNGFRMFIPRTEMSGM